MRAPARSAPKRRAQHQSVALLSSLVCPAGPEGSCGWELRSRVAKMLRSWGLQELGDNTGWLGGYVLGAAGVGYRPCR